MNTRNTRYALLADAVLSIEREMRQLGLWTEEDSADVPSPEAFASTAPFCIDTMTFSQWIQFVLLARIKVLIEAGADLPDQSDVASMAEEYFAPQRLPAGRLIESIREMDRILTQGSARP